ncbi:MAG: ABC transporter permease [Actinomycetota bacterium]|nr:ABC transporter permease [Actinomycetota bacterium]
MSARGPVMLVARREFATRMVTKSNIISMAVMVVAIIVIGVGAKFFIGDDAAPKAMSLAVDPSTSELAGFLASPPGPGNGGVTVSELDEATARAALEDDDADPRLAAWVTGDVDSPTVVFERDPNPEVLGIVEQAARDAVTARSVTELGGDPALVEAAVAAVTVEVDHVVEPEGELDGGQWVVAVVIISLLLFTLIGSGSLIAMGVVEEKTSRVVELLLSTIRPGQLLTGKVLGIGAYGLFQMVVLGGALAGVVSATGLFPELDVDLGAAFALMLVWFLLGFGVFALLFGGFAALVSRQEDIGSVTTPLMFALFVPYYVTLFLVPFQPDSTLVKVLSQIPFFSPFMMPTRAATGLLEPWEMPLALLITGATIPLLVGIAARVYRRAVLHTGGRMKLSEALRPAAR